MSDYVINPITSTLDAVKSTTELYAIADTRYLQLSGGTMTGAINSLSVIPTVDSASDLGSSSKYFANAYTDKIYLNSTASLSGAVAGKIGIFTDAPDEAVHIAGTTGDLVMFLGSTGGSRMGFEIKTDLTNEVCYFQAYKAGVGARDIWLRAKDIYLDGGQDYDAEMVIKEDLIVFRKPLTTESNANLSLVPNGTGYTMIGNAGTTSHTLNTNDDLLVSGRLEVDGILYADSTVDTSDVYKVDGTQVVSNRVIDARADDVANSGDATTDGLIDALRDAMIAHGLIAAA